MGDAVSQAPPTKFAVGQRVRVRGTGLEGDVRSIRPSIMHPGTHVYELPWSTACEEHELDPVAAPAPRYAVGDTVKHTDKYGATAIGAVMAISLPYYDIDLGNGFGVVALEHDLCLVQSASPAPMPAYRVGDLVRLNSGGRLAWVECMVPSPRPGMPKLYQIRWDAQLFLVCDAGDLEPAASATGAEVLDTVSRMQAWNAAPPTAPAPTFKVGDRVAWDGFAGTYTGLVIGIGVDMAMVRRDDELTGLRELWVAQAQCRPMPAVGPCPDCKGRGTYEGAGFFAWGQYGGSGPCATCNGKGRV